MATETSFNATSIMLQTPTARMNPSSNTSPANSTTNEEHTLSNTFYQYHASLTSSSSSIYDINLLVDEEDDEDLLVPVPQHLDSDQIQYEFPPKSRLEALAYLDQLEQEYSFFDETSFTNDSSISLSSGYFDEHREEDSLSIRTPSPPQRLTLHTSSTRDYRGDDYHRQLFSPLIDGSRQQKDDLDLTRIDHHMFTHHHHHHHHHHASHSPSSSSRPQHHHQWRQTKDHHEIQGQPSFSSSPLPPPPSFTTTAQSPPPPPPLIADHRLSPLQLPLQLYHQQQHSLEREESYDSTSTITKNAIVAPHSFLTLSPHIYNSNYLVNPVSSSCHVTQTDSYSLPPRHHSLDSLVDLPIIISETTPILEHLQQEYDDDFDRDSMTSDDLYPPQQVVLIKISKRPSDKRQQRQRQQQQQQRQRQQHRCPTSSTHQASDEGYVDEDQEGKLGGSGLREIDSASVFLPVGNEEEHQHISNDDYTPARPSCIPSSSSLTNNSKSTSSVDSNAQWGLRATWTKYHQEQAVWAQRIQHLEQQLKEERAMRMAFEKAMEDMTVVMDQQQKVLYERLDQEIRMRQAYEHKMQQTLAHVEPLEAQMEKETASRIQLEEAMVHVLDQLDFLQAQHQQHVQDDATDRSRMQTTLDQVLSDINKLTNSLGDATHLTSGTTTTSAASVIDKQQHHRASKAPSSSSNVITPPSSSAALMSSKTHTVSKPPARSNTISAVKSAASGTTANTNMPRSKSRTTTTNNHPKSSTMPPAPMSRKSKFPNNNNTTTKTNNNKGSTTPAKTLVAPPSSSTKRLKSPP